MKIGFGFDSHRIEKGRKLILGGIDIKSDFGLAGFSDADVIIHALCDAILGAIGERDIGEHFPDTDEVNRERSSSEFLEYIRQMLDSQGYRINNIDITVILEKPNLVSYKEKIKDNLATILAVQKDKVAIKAKHPEGAFSENSAVCFALTTLLKV